MKKTVIALAIFGVFILYSLVVRHQTPAVIKPTSLSSSGASSSGTNVGSSGSGTPPSNTSTTPSAPYKDGTYTGSVADAFYGNVQVSAAISGGKIVSVQFLQYPNTHSTSVMINRQAMPFLIQEAIQAQSSNVQIVSGATLTSQAFQQSLSSALSQA